MGKRTGSGLIMKMNWVAFIRWPGSALGISWACYDVLHHLERAGSRASASPLPLRCFGHLIRMPPEWFLPLEVFKGTSHWEETPEDDSEHTGKISRVLGLPWDPLSWRELESVTAGRDVWVFLLLTCCFCDPTTDKQSKMDWCQLF